MPLMKDGWTRRRRSDERGTRSRRTDREVDGTRVIDANDLPGTSAACLVELQQLVTSVRFNA